MPILENPIATQMSLNVLTDHLSKLNLISVANPLVWYELLEPPTNALNFLVR